MNLKSFESLNERERRMVIIGAVCVVLLLIFGVILPLDHSVARAQARITTKQADLAWMHEVTPELTSSEPSGAGGLQVRLEKAPFDAVVAWLARLSEQEGIRVDSATIDNAGQPGIINAGVVLHVR